jgi:phage terminase large subunit-like protein
VNREDYQTYVGVDLAATSDLTALSFLVTNGDNYFVKNYYFVPQTALTDKSNKELYKE